ncbi:MAG: HhH-GPD family protein [Minisyncoccota bacterium]
MPNVASDVSRFRRTVWAHYGKHGRHDLLWRTTRNPYRILVSEIMLQQTQVDRVLPFYKDFIKKFPTAKKLAVAPLSDVLKSWQGLGYNRRAKMLHAAAKEIAIRRMPCTVVELEKLSGVGPYTARAIAAFAYNQDVILVETNIRTAIIHHFFSAREKVSDTEVEEILTHVLPKGRAREWYSALMDYGAHLKRSGISHNARSTKHVVQSKFAGSLREARGALMRELAGGGATRTHLTHLLGLTRHEQVSRALDALTAEGLVSQVRGRYRLSD